ncbi:hypothetical protein [Methylobacterium marchantiae]|uniref:Uncharacterized protein n=1 Tax=Methylobacterium marchantiae TaxID=600331 RepID=A0ABW3WTF8_9HYPH|nr:hypothetical protein AIGOOFII_0516 [Methylobacterium marchantiae]
MTLRRTRLIALATLIAATGLGMGQAQAQVPHYPDYGNGRAPYGQTPYGYGQPRGYDRSEGYGQPYEDDGERRPLPRQYGNGRQRIGSVCVTARGNCPAYPSPIQTPCRCDIPGFGPKRGAVLQ